MNGETEVDDSRLEKVIGYTFRDPALLRRALTRRARAQEDDSPDSEGHMDALATLGDAVIDTVVLESLYAAGIADKGEMSVAKMNMVNMSSLRGLAESIGLSDYVLWGKGERHQHVWTSGRVLAECMEALCGAVYLDGGMDAVRNVLKRLLFLV
ncbi:ribonuclease III [Methanomicrobiaceae archaeon CYW5]|uniref:ribonuclease III domain-containing protein n=1 Tax=Methanovulcanius yangii TaxID=1789227 RepID=UPI0029CA2093|nr:ribonuclease III domain-containing protein [Methanovulcanius yangii]MBT8508506.1 ribonuclease III [Methanovulcanius yangii]